MNGQTDMSGCHGRSRADTLKKPSMLTAIMSLISAICFLLIIALHAARGVDSPGLFLFQIFTFILMTISAVGNWVLYFKRYIKYEIASQVKD